MSLYSYVYFQTKEQKAINKIKKKTIEEMTALMGGEGSLPKEYQKNTEE